MIKFIRLLSVALFAASLLATPVFAAEGCCPAKAQEQKKGCCPAKAEDQKKCNGEKGCPFKDAKNGKPCEKAQPKKAEEKK